MESKPEVSILLPTLNAGPFIKERIASIEQQTLGNWEVIACDSSSTDGTRETLDAFAARDPRVKVFEVPKCGIYPAWNDCLERARGEYIYIATADDSFCPEFLERTVELARTCPEIGIVYTPLQVTNADGSPAEWDWRTSNQARYFGDSINRVHRRSGQRELVRVFFMGSMCISMTQLLIRRVVFEAAGHFPTQFGSAGDLYWYTKAICHTDIVFQPSVFATWRRHEKQATGSDSEKHVLRNLAVLSARLAELHGHSLAPQLAYGLWSYRTISELASLRTKRSPKAAADLIATISRRPWSLVQVVRSRLDCPGEMLLLSHCWRYVPPDDVCPIDRSSDSASPVQF